MDSKRRALGWLATIGIAGAALLAPATVSATRPDPQHTVTICHRTNSVTHPYNRITVDEAAVDGQGGNDNGHGDHLLNHTGPTFDVTADPAVAYPPPHNGNQWGDIIPPFHADGVTATGHATLNWDAAGQAIFNAGCAAAIAAESASVESVNPSGSVEAETGSAGASGSVEAVSGASDGKATPPPTDVTGRASAPSGSGWQLFLLALASLLGVVTALPALSRRQRR